MLRKRPLRREGSLLESLERSKEKWWQEGERENTRDVDLRQKKVGEKWYRGGCKTHIAEGS